MPIYVYETIPSSDSDKPIQFEVLQGMSEEKLTVHPETGQPIRRVITAGLSIVSKNGDGGCCNSGGCGC